MTGYKVDENSVGKRLDVFLAEQVDALTRSQLQKLCQEDRVTVNKEVARVSTKLRLHDCVELEFDFSELSNVIPIELPILYEDDNVVVINKPVGVLTHSKGSFNPEATVATFIDQYWQGESDSDRNGIVHRLDRATSGVMICAKNANTLKHLQRQFNQRKTKKTYYAVIAAGLEPPEAIIDMPIARNPRNPKTFHVSGQGKPSQTKYAVTETMGQHSLIKLMPVTGRTHQLRVHLAELKYPIVGDVFYNGEPADRLYLHAETLEITIPGGERRVFTAPLPIDFYTWMKSHA